MKNMSVREIKGLENMWLFRGKMVKLVDFCFSCRELGLIPWS